MSSLFLHIVHPHCLRILKTNLQHVDRFRNYLNAHSPSGESAQSAKDVFIDSINSAGIDLVGLVALLDGVLGDAEQLSGKHLPV
jgi:hypothetical protein